MLLEVGMPFEGSLVMNLAYLLLKMSNQRHWLETFGIFKSPQASNSLIQPFF